MTTDTPARPPHPQRCDHHLMCGITTKEDCNDTTCKWYVSSTPAPELYNVMLKSSGELESDKLLVDAYKRGKVEGAKTERDRMLDVIRKTDACCCPHEMCHSGEGHDGLNCRDCLIKWIEESLRARQEVR